MSRSSRCWTTRTTTATVRLSPPRSRPWLPPSRPAPLGGFLANRAVFAQRVTNAIDRPIDLLAIDDERRCEARDRAVRVLAQNAVLEERFDELARGRKLGRDLHPDQQTLAADFRDRRTLDRLQALEQVLAHLRGALGQLLVDEEIERRESHRRGERVAAERAAVVAGLEYAQHFLARAERRDRDQPAAQRLAEDDAVGLHAFVVAGEDLAGAAEVRLHFVGDEENVVRAADARRLGEVSLGRNDDSRLALHGLHEERRGVGRDRGFESGGIPERHALESVRVGTESLAVFRLRGGSDDGRGASVEIAGADDDLCLVARHP